MLILTRKKNESLIINGDIEITIVSSDEHKVKIGIEAPKSVEIYRKEVFEKIQQENRQSIVGASHVEELKKFVKNK